MVFKDGLVSYWQFEEGWNDNIEDVFEINNGLMINMSNAAWIESQIPLGKGESDSQLLSSQGDYEFTDTGVSISTTSPYNNISITISKIEFEPNYVPENVNTVFDNPSFDFPNLTPYFSRIGFYFGHYILNTVSVMILF